MSRFSTFPCFRSTFNRPLLILQYRSNINRLQFIIVQQPSKSIYFQSMIDHTWIVRKVDNSTPNPRKNCWNLSQLKIIFYSILHTTKIGFWHIEITRIVKESKFYLPPYLFRFWIFYFLFMNFISFQNLITLVEKRWIVKRNNNNK